MRNCNYLITDANNKKRDLIGYTKHLFRGAVKLSMLIKINHCNYKELCDMHKNLPIEYKNIADKNLGTA